MILTDKGVLKLMQRIKSFITAQLNTKANSVHTHTISEIDDLSSLSMGGGYSKSEVDTLLNGKSDTGHTHTVSDVTDFPTLSTVATSGSYNDLSNKPTIPIVDSALSSTSTNALQNKVINTELSKKANTSHTHTVSDVTDFPSLATVATSGSYNDLSNKPTIPTVNNGTLTIQQNGTTVDTFTANSSSDKTVNISVPTKTSDLTNDSGYITGVAWNDVSNKPSFATVATSGSYNDLSNKPTIPTVNNGTLTIQKNGTTVDTFTANSSTDKTVNISVPTNTSELTNGAGYITADYAIPRSGGAVISGAFLGRVNNTQEFKICGGTSSDDNAVLVLSGKGTTSNKGYVGLLPNDGSNVRYNWLHPDGTWTWNGTACQILSDQRLKQQITEIDDKLLDAWEDVNLVQFKYNDAVDQKGKDKARLHTGYVVQQIDSACKSHNVDISEYGLYCHEEYPQETEEVEVTQDDGTKTKERKVIREASEHYSLRYTETLVVECAYLRRENARLKQQMQQYSESLSKLEERLKALEQTSK